MSPESRAGAITDEAGVANAEEEKFVFEVELPDIKVTTESDTVMRNALLGVLGCLLVCLCLGTCTWCCKRRVVLVKIAEHEHKQVSCALFSFELHIPGLSIQYLNSIAFRGARECPGKTFKGLFF